MYPLRSLNVPQFEKSCFRQSLEESFDFSYFILVSKRNYLFKKFAFFFVTLCKQCLGRCSFQPFSFAALATSYNKSKLFFTARNHSRCLSTNTEL